MRCAALVRSRVAVRRAAGGRAQRSAGDRSHGGVEATRRALAVTELGGRSPRGEKQFAWRPARRRGAGRAGAREALFFFFFEPVQTRGAGSSRALRVPPEAGAQTERAEGIREPAPQPGSLSTAWGTALASISVGDLPQTLLRRRARPLRSHYTADDIETPRGGLAQVRGP